MTWWRDTEPLVSLTRRVVKQPIPRNEVRTCCAVREGRGTQKRVVFEDNVPPVAAAKPTRPLLVRNFLPDGQSDIAF